MNFIVNWSNNKTKSWSGTHYSLFQALKKNININEISVKLTFYETLITNLRKILFNFLSIKDFRAFEIKHIESKANILINNNDINFVFEEYKIKNISNTYLYIDLSISYLNHLYLNKSNLLKYTPLKLNVLTRDLNFRIKQSKYFIENCKGIFTMSKWLRDFMIQDNPKLKNKIHHVGGGSNIDVKKINYKLKTGNKFLFVGVDWKRKNGPLVLKAFERLQKKYPEIELYIAGPKRINSLDCENVILLGNLNYDELVNYFNVCDFFVMPSKFEAYGLVFAEALLFGLPCIGKNSFAMPEFINNGKNGLLIEKDSCGELVKAMENIYINRLKYKNFVNSNHDFYKKEYSWNTVAQKIIRIMNDDSINIQ